MTLLVVPFEAQQRDALVVEQLGDVMQSGRGLAGLQKVLEPRPAALISGTPVRAVVLRVAQRSEVDVLDPCRCKCARQPLLRQAGFLDRGVKRTSIKTAT